MNHNNPILWQHEHVLVAGLGVSGKSAVAQCEHLGAMVSTFDAHAQATWNNERDIDWSLITIMVVSPVFAPTSELMQQAIAHHIRVMSEVELAWHIRVEHPDHSYAPWIGITGTNGKTTTTEMTAAMLQHAGLHAPAVGNIGVPVSQVVTDSSVDACVVELSSFQMHTTDSLRLRCAAITNLADDHLDWHGGFKQYAAAKAKVYHGVTDVLVYNADDKRVTALAMNAKPAPGCRTVGFTLHEPQSGQIGVVDGVIVDRSGLVSDEQGSALASISQFTHLCEPDGTVYPHLLADALCATALALGYGIAVEDVVEALKSFSPGGHRIATVASLGAGEQSIRFIDDSKATNAHAALASLSSFADGQVVWIAGGLAKGSRFEDLIAQMHNKLSAVVVIGVDQEPMLHALAQEAPDIPVTRIAAEPKGTVMERAVQAAGQYARGGQVVLMAPACASMDQFMSYADRGDQFAKAARTWVEAHGR